MSRISTMLAFLVALFVCSACAQTDDGSFNCIGRTPLSNYPSAACSPDFYSCLDGLSAPRKRHCEYPIDAVYDAASDRCLEKRYVSECGGKETAPVVSANVTQIDLDGKLSCCFTIFDELHV